MKKIILIVDDDRLTLSTAQKLLEGEYKAVAVNSGKQAFKYLERHMPDLILLDYEMPVCDGRYVLEMLRSEAEFADIPVIFLTSKDDPESVKKVLELKPDGYLLKYLKPADIRKRIDDFFKTR